MWESNPPKHALAYSLTVLKTAPITGQDAPPKNVDCLIADCAAPNPSVRECYDALVASQKAAHSWSQQDLHVREMKQGDDQWKRLDKILLKNSSAST